ncbi:MAG: sulfatase [Verrucomicrobiae bacterium]|nr:sulfatase [Verrucomicrobiae bacterium]
MRFLCLLLPALLFIRPVAAADQPNFIIINIDDLGYADIGPFGSKLNRTPNLDRMAEEGRKLTHYYAAPVCSPSRAALMTGSYPKRVLPIPHVLFPSGAVGLNPDEVTVAEVLHEAGYRTGCIGKWHLGDQPPFLPVAQGFDYYLGIPYSNDMGTAEEGTKSDLGAPIPKPKGDQPKTKGETAILETGLTGMTQPPLPLVENDKVVGRVKQDEHQAIVDTYTEAAVKFVKENSENPFFLYLPHSAVHFPLYPGKDWVGKSGKGLYSDWVEEVDWSVGRVLDTVRELGIGDRTLVMFTSDNGGTSRASNAPLRGNKGSTWEGGVRVPTVLWWPGTIPPGTSSDEITGMHDILPTFAALAGAKIPDGHRLDGLDVSGVFLGREGAKGHEVFHYFRGFELQAIRQGNWKLHFGTNAAANANGKGKGGNGGRPVGLALFDLEADPGEMTNVADNRPEIVKQLKDLAAVMDADLGIKPDSQGPGVRPLGRVEHPEPFINHEGKVRANALGVRSEFP